MPDDEMGPGGATDVGDDAPVTIRGGRTAIVSFPDDDPDHRPTDVTQRVDTMASKVQLDAAFVTVLNGPAPGRIVELGEGETVIGRSREADLYIEDRGMSRRHARLRRWLGVAFVVEDLGSANGTFVNGQAIERRTPLRNGDRIQLGPRVVLRFTVGDRGEAELQRNLYEGATRDPLTGLFNRAYVLEQLRGEVAFAARHGTEVCVILLDVDHFKRVNDGHGHLAGDEVLREVAQRLQGSCRTEDSVARYGGEEFLMVLRETDTKSAMVVAERARRALADRPIAIDGAKELTITISLGVATMSELSRAPSIEGLLGLADERLYRAKDRGRNQICAT